MRWTDRLLAVAGRALLAAGLVLALLPAAPGWAASDDDTGPSASLAGVPRWWEKDLEARPPMLIMLSEPAPEDWSVLVTTSDGTALAPGDYLAVAERVLIPAGGREVAVPIEVVADRVVEPAEWFAVTISEPSAGTIQTDRVEITICDGSPPHCGAG
jgi:hypothetical protein